MQNILVVEDDSDLNQAICYSLKKSGYGVYGVTFMEKGKQIFFENQIDMVLLDVNLPDGEGFSFCQWVKKQKEVPVIYLTARDMEEDALTGYESGAEDYVTKPFSMKILLRKIEVILKRTASVNRLIFESCTSDGKRSGMPRYTDRVPSASSISYEPGTASDL